MSKIELVPEPGIRLNLEPEVMDRLAALIPVVSQSSAAREFGIRVDHHVVARVALLRGLYMMEGGKAAPEPVKTNTMNARPPIETEKPTPVVVEQDIDRDPHGKIKPPDGWLPWPSIERIPVIQSSIDEYYTSHGWKRYSGRVQGETISFYWSDDETLQDLAIYDQTDVNGKAVLNQATPWGPGHIIPHKWAGI
jgi:hypothetical protein